MTVKSVAEPQESAKLACGCDPAELPGKAVLQHVNPNMFGPGMGFMIQQCSQCKQILGFACTRSVTQAPQILTPSQWKH